MIASKQHDRKQDLMEIKLCEQEITKLDIEVKKSIAGLLNLNSGTTQQNLTTYTREIKSQLAKLEDKVALLGRIAGKWNSRGEDGNALREELKSHQEELAKNQQQLWVNSRRALQVIDQQSRNALFEQNTDEFELRRRKQQQEDMMQISTKKTDTLSDLVSRMGEQLKFSEETTSALIHSSATIRDTDEQFTTMGATIKSGGKLLSKYGRRETTDKILIIFALIFYLGTVLYILRKRAFPHLF